MAGVVGDGLLAQVDDGGNGHGVTAEDVGQVLTDAASGASVVSATSGVVVTGLVVGVAGVVVGVLGAIRGLGGGEGRSGGIRALRSRLGPALRGLRLNLGTVLSLGTVLNLVLGIGRGSIIGSIGSTVTSAVVDGTVGDVSSPLIRFGHGLPSRLGAAGPLGVLRRSLVPALVGEGMHLGLLGGDGHRLERFTGYGRH